MGRIMINDDDQVVATSQEAPLAMRPRARLFPNTTKRKLVNYKIVILVSTGSTTPN